MTSRSEFETELEVLGFKSMIEDDPDDAEPSVVMWHKFCHTYGCERPWQQHLIGADVYDPGVLGLLLERIRDGDCGHSRNY